MGLTPKPTASDPLNEEAADVMQSPTRAALKVALGAVVAFALYTAAMVFGKSYGLAFFSIPFFVGVTAGALGFRRPYRSSAIALGVALLVSIVTMREGVICVLFSLPVLFPFLVAGAASGSVITRHVRSQRARRASVGALLLLGFSWQVWEGLTANPAHHPRHTAASELAIAKGPGELFELLTSEPLEVSKRWPWFIRIGLPMPQRMSVEVPGPDGRLRFDLVPGSAFARVTAWRPGKELSYRVERYAIDDLPFHVTRLGQSPNYGFRNERVDDWLTLEETSFTFEPLPGGETLLRRRVTWRRHLAPDLYFGWLQQTVMQRGQDRLLELIAEKATAGKDRPDSGRAQELSAL